MVTLLDRAAELVRRAGAAAGGHGGAGHGGGHGAVDAKTLALRAKQLAMGKRSAWLFAVALSGLISVFIIGHFFRTLMHLQANRRGSLAKSLVAPFR